MKFSSAALTVAAISLLSTTQATPVSFKNGEISGRIHHRRGSDISEFSSSSVADEVMEDLDVGFEPGAALLLPRILNFFKRQTSAPTGELTSSSRPQEATEGHTSGASDTDLHTTVTAPGYESYGFAAEGGPDTALPIIREVKG